MNDYRGGGRDNSFGRQGFPGNRRGGSPNRTGNGRPAGQGQTITEIKPEIIPEDYLDRAENIMLQLMQENDRRNVITTSKIRNLLSMIIDIYDVEKLRREDTLDAGSIAGLGMMRVRTAYECGRDPATKTFVERTRLLSYIKGVGTSRERLLRLAHYMEALVAYHRFFGGKEN